LNYLLKAANLYWQQGGRTYFFNNKNVGYKDGRTDPCASSGAAYFCSKKGKLVGMESNSSNKRRCTV